MHGIRSSGLGIEDSLVIHSASCFHTVHHSQSDQIHPLDQDLQEIKTKGSPNGTALNY
jgi:hypothetical protein